jgi:Predicted metal-binding integral membrane protein (DUF2182)
MSGRPSARCWRYFDGRYGILPQLERSHRGMPFESVSGIDVNSFRRCENDPDRVKTIRVFCKSLTNFCKYLKMDRTIALFLSFHTVSTGLMLILVAVGVMNIPAMAALTIVIFAEKLLRHGLLIARLIGISFFGVAVVAVIFPNLFPALKPCCTPLP